MKKICVTPIEAEILLSAVVLGAGNRKSMAMVERWTARLREALKPAQEAMNKVKSLHASSEEFTAGLQELLRAEPLGFTMEQAEFDLLNGLLESRTTWANAYAPVLNQLGRSMACAEDVDAPAAT